jgi:hypothetical protein
MPVVLKNNARTVTRQDLTAVASTIVVADGSVFPTLGAGEYFYLTLMRPDTATEIVKVLAVVDNSLTVTRAQEGTAAREFPTGSFVEARVTAASVLEAASDAVDALTLGDLGITATASEINVLDGITATTPTLNAAVTNSTQTRDTVALLLADTTLTYTAGQPGSVTAGQYVRTRSEGFAYTVAASGASDHHVTTAGGVKLYLSDLSDIDVRAFGPPTTGSASLQLQAALNLWYNRLRVGGSDRPVVLRIVGKYTVATGLALTLSANTVAHGVIDMTGGSIVSTLTSGTVFKLSARAVNRKIDLVSFNIQGSGSEDVVLEIDGGDANASPAAFLYGVNLVRPKIEGFSKIGIDWYNNAFESTIDDPFLACTSTAAGSYCLRFRSNVGGATSGVVSSIVIRGGSFRGGINNLYVPGSADIKCFGSTFLEAGEECVREDNAVSSVYSGVHIENAWENGGGGTYMAGIRGDNAVTIHGAYFTSNNGNHNTGVRAFVAGTGADVNGIRFTGGVTTAVYIANNSDNGSEAKLSGLRRSTVKTASGVTERIVSFGGRKKVRTVDPATGAQDLNVDLYNMFEFTLTGNITINAPTGMFRGDEIIIRLTQGGSGSYTVTWNGVFIRSLALGSAVGARAIYHFYWTGGAWLPIAETAS